MNFLFNEQAAIENMIKLKVIDNDNIFNTIKDLAKYNYFVCGMDQDSNYKAILSYLHANGDEINEEAVYDIIDNCVKKVKHHPLKYVNEIKITKSELDFIKNLDDIRKEKVVFVLLAVIKYYNAISDEENDVAYMKNSDICKYARITIPKQERDVFMQFLYDEGVLKRHHAAASTIKIGLFISHDINDKIILKLNENDYKDLAYTYMAYLEPHKFRRCSVCGKWMRRNKQGSTKCRECVKLSEALVKKDPIKTVTCIDCGNEFYTTVLNTKSQRCESCQEQKNKELKSERNAKYYKSHKIKTLASENCTVQN